MMTLRQFEETRAMAQNEKGGADLDIFEDLGKKGAPPRPSSGRSVPPPPPSSLRAPEGAKRTLLGVTAPPATSPGAFPPAPSSPSRLPPPPPGRGSLPPVVGPPSAKLPPTPAPPAARAANSVDVDWDDEEDEATQIFAQEEQTHIFAEDATHVLEEDQTRAIPSAPMPAAGMPAPLPSRPKATLLGLTAPQALPAPSRPPISRSTPPPPPSRSSGFPPPPGPSGFSFPPTINPAPGPLPTQKGLGSAAPWSSIPPAPARPPQGMPSIPRQASAPDYGTPPPRNMEATTMLAPKLGPMARPLVIGVAVGLACLALWMVFAPSKGSIVVNVSDQRGAGVNRLDVFIDGKKSPCETAPCILEETTGSHEVKVLADGYDAPAVQAVVVEGHRPTPANFVVGSSHGTGLKVSGVQAGVKLFVDDKELGPLPQDVHDLAPGDHVIRVAGSERYQPLEKHVTVERDRVEDLGTVTLKVLKGKVTVAPGTGGARVYIVSGSDRRELPMLPISVDIDTTKSWSLEASKSGYEDYRQLISFDDGQAEKAYTVTLEPKAAGGPPTQAVPYYSSPSPAPAPRPGPAPERQAAAPSEGGGGGEGYLNINSIPASTCYLDGKALGSTPRLHVSVKPGSHTVKFVDSDDGLTKTIFVSVGAGETKPAVTKLN